MKLNLEGVIPIVGGVYGLLVAFGVVRLSRNPEANVLWLRKFGLLIKIISPIVLLFGIAQFFGLIR